MRLNAKTTAAQNAAERGRPPEVCMARGGSSEIRNCVGGMIKDQFFFPDKYSILHSSAWRGGTDIIT